MRFCWFVEGPPNQPPPRPPPPLNTLNPPHTHPKKHSHSYVPSAVKDLIKEDLKLTDAQTSYPLTGMILVYMVSWIFLGGKVLLCQIKSKIIFLLLYSYRSFPPSSGGSATTASSGGGSS